MTSKFFADFRYSRYNKNKIFVSVILDNKFWNDCLIIVQIMTPLVCLLRIVDCDERLSMGYVYEGMFRARLGIKKLFKHNKRLYKPYTQIIKQHWDQQLHNNIHAAAYWLNPCFQYDHGNIYDKSSIIGVVMDVIDQKLWKDKHRAMHELRLFCDRLESLGRELAYSSCELLQPSKKSLKDYHSVFSLITI